MGRAVRCCYHGRTIWGIASSQSPLDSASALRRKLLSLPCSSFSAAIRFAGFASEAWEAERENDSVTEESASFPWQNQPGDSSVALLPLNDVRGVSAAQGCGGNVDAKGGRGRWIWAKRTRKGHAHRRHPREAGIPRSGAHARQWMRRPEASVIQRPQAVESPTEGGAVRHCYLPATIRGIASSQSPRGSASALR